MRLFAYEMDDILLSKNPVTGEYVSKIIELSQSIQINNKAMVNGFYVSII